jgi:hypothetical protein
MKLTWHTDSLARMGEGEGDRAWSDFLISTPNVASGRSIAPAWIGRAAQPAVESLACLVRQRILQPTAPEVSLFEYWSFRLKVLDRWPQRVQNLLGSFNPSEAEWADWPLPRCLSFLYYPLRFSRLLREYGRGLTFRRH